MRPDKNLRILTIEWLAALVLLASQAGATDRVPCSPLPSPCSPLSPRFSDLEQRLFDQIHDGRFHGFSLLQAGLIAGGVERDDELRRYGKRFEDLVEALRRSGKVQGTPCERARAVFAFLHQSILRGGYSLQASDLRQSFDHGRFNCVTASVLFNCLAERFGLKAVGLEIPGHAMSRLELPDETLDIETTCPRWFALIEQRSTANPPAAGEKSVAVLSGALSKPDAQARNEASSLAIQASLARQARQQGAARSDRRQVSEVELVATIYYNRGVDLLAEKRFADAAAANAKALRLDPQNATAKGNLLATINNWAIDLGTSGEYEKAAELFRLGLATDPSYDAFHANYLQLFRQWSEHLCRDGRYRDALRLLNEAGQGQPGEKFFREAAVEVLRRWAER